MFQKFSFKDFFKMILVLVILFSCIWTIIVTSQSIIFKKRFNFQDPDMTKAFFDRNQSTLDKYGIKYIEANQSLNHVTKFDIDYKIAGFKNPSFTINAADINCLINDNVLINNVTKELNFNEHDISFSGKQKVFDKAENCVYEISKTIDTFLKQESNLTEKFEIK